MEFYVLLVHQSSNHIGPCPDNKRNLRPDRKASARANPDTWMETKTFAAGPAPPVLAREVTNQHRRLSPVNFRE